MLNIKNSELIGKSNYKNSSDRTKIGKRNSNLPNKRIAKN